VARPSGPVGWYLLIQERALTSLQKGKAGCQPPPAMVGTPKAGREQLRPAEAHGQHTAKGNPSSRAPTEPCNPRQAAVGGKQADSLGHWPHSPRDCSPSRQAEIKVTGVSLVSLTLAGPAAPIPLDPRTRPSHKGPSQGLQTCHVAHYGTWGTP
jgi:hypothetical protein